MNFRSKLHERQEIAWEEIGRPVRFSFWDYVEPCASHFAWESIREDVWASVQESVERSVSRKINEYKFAQ